VKIYLEVTVEERARRRAVQRGEADDESARRRIEDDLRRRDGIDSSREAAPLRVPDGAIVIETDRNTLKQTVEQVVGIVHEAGG
jgi:cytidylate kinase